MDFLYGGVFRTGLPEAYERLILDCMLGDATLFTRDPKGFEAAISRIAAARDELSKSEEQWLDLEMKREELEG